MWLITIRSRNSASEHTHTHTHTHTSQRIKSRNSNKYLYIHVHSNIIHNIEKMEATQVCIDRWVDKMWYILTVGYCLALKRKELQIHSAVWMDLEDILLCLNVRHKNINTVWVNLYEVLRGVRFIEVERRVERTSLVARGWEAIYQHRRHGSDLGSGKIPQASAQLSPRVVTTEPTSWNCWSPLA